MHDLYSGIGAHLSPSPAAGLCNEPILINDMNVRIYVPDMPEEYFRLPYPAAKADMLRYGLLYHHGGIYFDPDVLAKDSDMLHQKLSISRQSRMGTSVVCCSDLSSEVVKDLDEVIQLAAEKGLVSYIDQKDSSQNCVELREASRHDLQ